MITIFIADDHAVVRDGLRVLLEEQPDFEVIGDAADGREAVRRMTGRCPDIAILDIGMPELNGIEAARQVCQACPTTQVIILSMHAAGSHIFRALQAGARGYLLKASAGREVIEAIKIVHAGHRYLGREISDRMVDEYLNLREAKGAPDALTNLTPREREVLQLIVEGKSSVQIAEILFLSPGTVDTYRSRLMRKLAIKDVPGLVKFAVKHGLTSLE